MNTTASTRRALAALLDEGLVVAGVPHAVRRAWPADLDDPGASVVLELLAQAPDEGAAPARRLVGATLRGDRVDVVGADPVLGALPERGLVGLRPGKRAVWRDAKGRYVKAARPKATRRALARAASVEMLLRRTAGAPARPVVRHADLTVGRLVLDQVEGSDLRSLLASADEPEARQAGRQIGAALVALARVRPPAPAATHHADPTSTSTVAPAHSAPESSSSRVDLPTHTSGDEAQVLRRWAAAALALAPLTDDEADLLRHRVPQMSRRLVQFCVTTPDLALSHRDLHDGQVLLHESRVTFLDWDTAAWADPVLDVANLLAHVDRYARRGARPADCSAFAAELSAALDAGGHPSGDPASATRLRCLRETTALRLLAVHAFRRRHYSQEGGYP